MNTMEKLQTMGAITEGAAGLAQAVASLYSGVKSAQEAEKAQAWNEQVWADQLRQNRIENELEQKKYGLAEDQQYFTQEIARLQEARKDKENWQNTLKNARNKYADILNTSRSMRKETAAAFRNR